MRELGRFTIGADHPALPGHFPGRPVVPGVVVLDEVAALVLQAEPGKALAGFPSVRFSRPVLPGMVVTVLYGDGGFTCQVDGAGVARGTIAFR